MNGLNRQSPGMRSSPEGPAPSEAELAVWVPILSYVYVALFSVQSASKSVVRVTLGAASRSSSKAILGVSPLCCHHASLL